MSRSIPFHGFIVASWGLKLSRLMSSRKIPPSPKKTWRVPESCDELLREVLSWNDVCNAIRSLGSGSESTKQKGDVFERFVQLYLQLEPDYQFLLESVWLYGEVPVDLKRELNLANQDRGIDLIAKTKRGEYWAIQAKYRSMESGSMPLREVSTFVSQAAAIGRNIKRGIICATKREKCPDCESATFDLQQILLDTWETRSDEFWANVRQAAAHEIVEPLVPYKPRPYQALAVRAATKHFLGKDSRRGKLIMPCGTGKSLMGYWTATKALKAKTVVVSVPSLDLIRQTFSVWARETVANRKKLDVLIVCSDKSTATGDTHVDDLAAPVKTDPIEIRKWLESPRGANILRVVFVTYQSGKVFADAAGGFHFDVGLFDEAHKTAGYEGKRNQYLLYQKNLKISRRVFMTATERYYEGESDEVVGMNDKRLYGERY